MTKKLPTSAEKPLTYEERYNGVCKNLEKRNDEIISLQNYADALEDKLISIASDYNIEIDVEDLIIDNFKQKFIK